MAIDPQKLMVKNYTCYRYLVYIPVRFDDNISEEILESIKATRQFIYNFKDGRSGREVGADIAEDVEMYNLSGNVSDWWLCVIPASNPIKTHNRYNQFCEQFCKTSRMNNGFKLITCTGQREQLKTASNRSCIDVLENISFENVNGKKILLFDDVVTTGKSFSLIANKLLSLGAIEVVGLFLAETKHI